MVQNPWHPSWSREKTKIRCKRDSDDTTVSHFGSCFETIHDVSASLETRSLSEKPKRRELFKNTIQSESNSGHLKFIRFNMNIGSKNIFS